MGDLDSVQDPRKHVSQRAEELKPGRIGEKFLTVENLQDTQNFAIGRQWDTLIRNESVLLEGSFPHQG